MNELLSIPTWRPNQIEGCFDFTEENLDKALENIKSILLEYNGVITLRRCDGQLNFGAILHEQEESEILETESDSAGEGLDESLQTDG